jgi:MoxR-like ATPase
LIAVTPAYISAPGDTVAIDAAARILTLLEGRSSVVPEDVERLFLPVVGHRLLLTSSYRAETRALASDEPLDEIRERCLELAPRPAPAWDR